MSLKHLLVSFLLSSAAVAAPAELFNRDEDQDGVEWGPCPEDDPNAALYATSPVPLECGTLEVPLDWTEPESNKKLALSLLRAPAPKQPAKGSIQINAGGPGLGGKENLVAVASNYIALSGEEYNIVAVDPRGVSAELPIVCATNNNTISQIFSTVADLSVSERELHRGWAWATQFVGTCQYLGNANDTAEYIGTAFMARDMAAIAEATDEDGLIRYWGVSYGTTLGATIAAMFPDRIDRMILDGIQNAKQYYYEYTDHEEWTLNDKVVDYLFDSCIEAGPELCALAAYNRSGADISLDWRSFIDGIAEAPIGLVKNAAILTEASLKSLTYDHTYAVNTWAEFSHMIAATLYGNEEERENALAAAVAPVTSTTGTERFLGIHCGDRVPRADSVEDILPDLRRQFSESYYNGGINGANMAVCAQWPWKAKEIYQGGFEAETKTPILFLTNSLDGQTPLQSARNMSVGFAGAVILENDGVGHMAFSYPNSCIAESIMAYWSDGNMPEEGKICHAEFGPFEKKKWTDIIAAMANGTVGVTDGVFSAREWLRK